MSLTSWLTDVYHGVVPIGIRRKLRLTRFTASRRARARLWRKTGGRVAAGVFKGALLPGTTPDDCYGAALIGAYECETHPWLEREVARGWTTAVNVGSNTGYYSTGLALRLPGATVHAFEMDDALRAESGESARRNGVGDRVVLHGVATPATLAALPVSAALVITDCEGAERELMDPVAVPWLARSALLVELHEFNAPGVTGILRDRFEHSHDIETVTQRDRNAVEWARAAGIREAEATSLLEELRPVNGAHLPGVWMLLSPRAGA